MTGVDDELVSPRRRLLVLVRRRPSAVPPTTSFRDRELAEQAEAAAKLRARKQRAGYDAEGQGSFTGLRRTVLLTTASARPRSWSL